MAFQDPELVKLLEKKSELYDQIVQKYQSVNKIKKLDQDLSRKHQTAANKVQACRRRLLRVQVVSVRLGMAKPCRRRYGIDG